MGAALSLANAYTCLDATVMVVAPVQNWQITTIMRKPSVPHVPIAS